MTVIKKRILVVDDDEAFVHVVSKRLQGANFDVQTADSRATFLRNANSFQPDLILLDILLGQDNGPEAFDELVRQGFPAHTPVIIMSSLTEDEPPKNIPAGRKMIMHSKFISQDILIAEIKALLQNS